ncbi:MAG: homogentisate 1,2-dioxygenase [Thermoplasmatota archaeon]
MIDVHRLGRLPAKHHIALYREGDDPKGDGAPVFYEHCLTRKGFDAEYSIAYRVNNPAPEVARRDEPDFDAFDAVVLAGEELRRRHVRTPGAAPEGTLWESLRWMVGNDDVRVGSAEPTEADSGLVQVADGDLLLFMHEGSGRLESELGGLDFRRHDYVWIPRGLVHRIRLDDVAGTGARPHVMVMECRHGLVVPRQFRNPVGQLKMDAPYSHRDFRRPDALSPEDDRDRGDPASWDGAGGFEVLHKRYDKWSRRLLPHHPFDVVGWDGTLYPVAFNVHDYQPKTSTVHLPPPIHTTFLGGKGEFVVCSFVPRKVDYHPDAIPCPYPHSSYDCDEILWYVEGDFASRKGVGPGSISLHPAGIPHAPQPGRYEASMGAERTDELAVMVDTFAPLWLTQHGLAAEDPDYHRSWLDARD